MTLKYRMLSSDGEALIPGAVLADQIIYQTPSFSKEILTLRKPQKNCKSK